MAIESRGSSSGTPLHWAAVGGHLEVVKYLVEQGASVTATTNYGDTAKAVARDNGHTAVVEYLESQGG